jgi:hypothetical protein
MGRRFHRPELRVNLRNQEPFKHQPVGFSRLTACSAEQNVVPYRHATHHANGHVLVVDGGWPAR